MVFSIASAILVFVSTVGAVHLVSMERMHNKLTAVAAVARVVYGFYSPTAVCAV